MTDERLSVDEVTAAFRAARASGIEVEPAALFHDLGRMRGRLARLGAAFPPGTLHALAIKANPLVEVLRAAAASGAGLEAASWEEVQLALAAGCPPARIVFDSPAKTGDELAGALALGVQINADSEGELDRLAGLVREPLRARIGLRINPEVGVGSIASTSVSAPGSRFGVPIARAEAIVDACRRSPWLTALHVHVGSQGCAIEQLVEAARRVEALRRRIDAALGEGRVAAIDLGGGLPVAYRDKDRPATPEGYVAALRASAAGLFDGGVALVTELGRWVQAGSGFAVSRVESVKPGRIATLHVGADLLLRRAYRPDDWHHDFVALDADARPKTGPLTPWTLAGPLCFAGDILARDLPLPELAPGDHVLVRDTGAYTLGMWSRHCSRGIPLVVGIDGAALSVLRERERPEDVVAFWSRDRSRPPGRA
jgi:diaminopimelate decarboxylase